MEIVTVRTSSNLTLALAENNVQTRRAIEVIKEMRDQAQAQITRIESRLAEDPFFQMPLDHREYLNTRLMGFRQLDSRLLNAWAEVAGLFDESDS